jgi:hypothetical protein
MEPLKLKFGIMADNEISRFDTFGKASLIELIGSVVLNSIHPSCFQVTAVQPAGKDEFISLNASISLFEVGSFKVKYHIIIAPKVYFWVWVSYVFR